MDELQFPEGANIRCYENRPGNDYNITIWAVPCDGIQECRDGSDERICKEQKWIFIGIILLLVLVTNCIYHYLKCQCVHWKQNIIPSKSNVDHWNSKECIQYKGDDLANLKVTIKYLQAKP